MRARARRAVGRCSTTRWRAASAASRREARGARAALPRQRDLAAGAGAGALARDDRGRAAARSSSPATPRRWRGKAAFAGFAPTKAAQRILAESLARTLGPQGVHVAYVVIDAVIDVPWTRRPSPTAPTSSSSSPTHRRRGAPRSCTRSARPGPSSSTSARSGELVARATPRRSHGHSDPPRSDWKSTACILCECNCGIEVQLGGADGRRLVRVRGDDAHPISQGLRLREAVAPRLLPERPAPADEAAAPARRRQLRGDRLGHRDPRGRRALRRGARRPRRRVDLLLRRRRPGEPPARAPTAARRARVLGSIYRSSALAQEKTGEFWVAARCSAATRARLRALRGGDLPRQEPVVLAQHPARARHAARDREGPEPLADRRRPAPHRDRGDRRHPPAGEARHRRVAARGAARRARAGGPGRARLARRARRRRSRRCCRTSRELAVADYCAACGVPEELVRSDGAPHRGARRAWRSSRTSACR